MITPFFADYYMNLMLKIALLLKSGSKASNLIDYLFPREDRHRCVISNHSKIRSNGFSHFGNY